MWKISKFVFECVGCIVRFYLTYIGLLHLQNSRILTAAIICNTTECRQLSEMYLKNMNLKANPCTDFYDYVCHGWAGNQCSESEYSRYNDYSVTDSMRDNAFKVLKKQLEITNVSPQPKVERAKDNYRACMKLPVMKRLKSNEIQNIMTNIGDGSPFLVKNYDLSSNISVWAVDIEYIKLTGLSALFGYQLKILPEKDYLTSIQFSFKFSPDGMIWRKNVWDAKSSEKSHYKKFLKKVLLNILPRSVVKDSVDKQLDHVMEFRDQLRLIRKLSPKPDFNETTIERFQRWYDIYSFGKYNRNVNWMTVINSLFPESKDLNGDDITQSTMIRVDTYYFQNLIRLLHTTPMKNIINHIHLYFAEKHLLFTPDMDQELQKAFDSNSPETNLILYDVPRWRKCIANNDMYDVLHKMYIDGAFPNGGPYDVQTLFQEAKYVLKQQILESKWLDSETKLKSIKKINSIEAAIGYPDWYTESIPANTKYDGNPTIPSARFILGLHRIYVTASFIQMPIYSPSLPYVAKYAGIMWVLSHELYHMFDAEGVTYDEDGHQPWWSDNMIAKHKKQVQCFEKNYERFKKQEIKKCKIQSSARRTLPRTTSEDVADAMGLKLAYRMYRNKLILNQGKCPVLPGFEKFGCEKLFFVSMANQICSISTTAWKKRLLLQDVHSPHQVRVNSAVANMREFNAVFGCKPKDRLYLEKTCDLWQQD